MYFTKDETKKKVSYEKISYSRPDMLKGQRSTNFNEVMKSDRFSFKDNLL